MAPATISIHATGAGIYFITTFLLVSFFTWAFHRIQKSSIWQDIVFLIVALKFSRNDDCIGIYLNCDNHAPVFNRIPHIAEDFSSGFSTLSSIINSRRVIQHLCRFEFLNGLIHWDYSYGFFKQGSIPINISLQHPKRKQPNNKFYSASKKIFPFIGGTPLDQFTWFDGC